MKKLLLSTGVAATLFSTAAMANMVPLIKNIDKYDDEKVTVSGVVTWVDAYENEFTLSDSSGDVEINLKPGEKSKVDVGDFVSVNGWADDDLLKDSVENAEVTIVDDDYDVWLNSYTTVYGIDYDYDGFSEDFMTVTTYDADLYDNTYVAW